jgi:hypothetical protein
MPRLALALFVLLAPFALLLPLYCLWRLCPPLSVGVGLLMGWCLAVLWLPKGKP